jgi:hypothetical protein
MEEFLALRTSWGLQCDNAWGTGTENVRGRVNGSSFNAHKVETLKAFMIQNMRAVRYCLFPWQK